MPKNTEFDIPTAIETLWIKMRKNENKNIASFESPAAAWSVTDIRGQFIIVPKMINDNMRGNIFAIDFYKNNYMGGSLNATVKIDNQPDCIYHFKNYVFVAASRPSPMIHVLDGSLFMQTVRVELNDVPTALFAVEKPYNHDYDLLIVIQSCGTVSIFKIGNHQTILT